MAKVQQGQFRTVWDAVQWVRGRWGVSYTYKSMYSLMKGNSLGVKVPRPRSEKAYVKQQLAFPTPWTRRE